MRKHLVVVSLLLTIAACAPKEATVSGDGGEAAPEPIKIGEYSALTGLTATFGQSSHNGIRIAVDEINAAGGVKGRPIKLLTEDTQSKPQEAANAVQKLISQDEVVAVLGEVASSRTLAAAPIAQQAKVPMISPSSTNPKVTEIGDYIFRINYIDPFQGLAGANFMVQHLGLTRAAILRDVKNDYSVGLAEFFQQTLEELGGEVVIDQSYAEGDSDFRSQLTAIKATNAQVIYVPGYYTEIGQIARQSRDLGINLAFLGGDGWESPKLIEIGGEALEGSFYTNAFYAEDPRPEARTFVKKYNEKFGVTPDALAALAYDAAHVLFDAMKRAESLDPTAIRDAIATVADFNGVTGVITIGPDRNAIKPIVVLGVKGGTIALEVTVHPDGRIEKPGEAEETSDSDAEIESPDPLDPSIP